MMLENLEMLKWRYKMFDCEVHIGTLNKFKWDRSVVVAKQLQSED